MYQPCWNRHILSKSPWACEADLVISCLTDVSQAHPAVATVVTEQEALRHHLITWHKVAYAPTNSDDFTGPFMTGNDGIVIVAFWSDSPVECLDLVLILKATY
jgi:hypothetical protein